MKFDIYGRFQLDIRREGNAWVAYRVGPGFLTPLPDLVLPADLDAADLPVFLDDLFHEQASPATAIRRVDA